MQGSSAMIERPQQSKALLALVCACCFFLGACTAEHEGPSAWDRELGEIDARLQAAIAAHAKGRADEELFLQLAYHSYSRAALTADYDDFAKAQAHIAEGLQAYPQSSQLQLFQLSLDFKLHRFQQALATAARLKAEIRHPHLAALLADIDLQLGHYAQAFFAYQQLLNPGGGAKVGWENLSRMAYYYSQTAAFEQADSLYQEAQNQLNARQMRHYAWLELQRGIMDLEQEHFQEALEHYRQADLAYSGYWLIEEHIAEVLALLGEEKEARQRYRDLVDRTHNPEFISALAALVENEEEAHSLQQQADAAFAKRSAQFPEASGGHYLEYLLSADSSDMSEVVDLAERNHQLRPNAEAKFLLAQAYEKAGRRREAKALLEEISKTPWRNLKLQRFSEGLQLTSSVEAAQ